MDSNLIWTAAGFVAGGMLTFVTLFTYSALVVSSRCSREEEAAEIDRFLARCERW